MIDAIDELVARSLDCKELQEFHTFHRAYPEVLDFLTEEIQLRIQKGLRTISFGSLWSYARGKMAPEIEEDGDYKMNDHKVPFYGRAITILHPEFNELAEFRSSLADDCFGTTIEPTGEGRRTRLMWADGTAIQDGWRPTIPHTLRPVARKPDIH
jgi:hypothetical protein